MGGAGGLVAALGVVDPDGAAKQVLAAERGGLVRGGRVVKLDETAALEVPGFAVGEPEAPNRLQHRIPSTNQQPMRTGTK